MSGRAANAPRWWRGLTSNTRGYSPATNAASTAASVRNLFTQTDKKPGRKFFGVDRKTPAASLFERLAWHEVGTEEQHVDVDLVVGFEYTVGRPVLEADGDHLAAADPRPSVDVDG